MRSSLFFYLGEKFYRTAIILLFTVAIAMMLVACGGEKNNNTPKEENVVVVEETPEVVEATPVVSAEAGTALIQELYTSLYQNGKHLSDVHQYFGNELSAKLNEQDGEMPLIDYDPFIDAQDYDGATVMNSLKITELSEGRFQVEVEPLKGTKTTLELTLGLDESGTLKILDIPSDSNISVLK